MALKGSARYTTSYTWTAALQDPIWTITATGSVKSVTGGTRTVTKTLKRKITMGNNAYIETSGARLNGVMTGQGCGSTPHNPCSSSDAIWANQYLAQTRCSRALPVT